MTRCPECDSRKVEEDAYSPESYDDGQGYESSVVHSYYCEDCGCSFTETFTTTRKVEILEHGKVSEVNI